MIIEKGKKPPKPKKVSNEAKPILCDTLEKAKQDFEVIVEDEEDSISLDAIWVIFFVSANPFFGRNYTDIFFGVDIVHQFFVANI